MFDDYTAVCENALMENGERIRLARIAKGWGQDRLAAEARPFAPLGIEIKQQDVQRIESGKVKRSSKVPPIERALGLSTSMVGGHPDSSRLGPNIVDDAQSSLSEFAGRRDDLPNEIQLPEKQPHFPPFQEMPKDIPVRGLGFGGEKGDFTFNGEEVDYVRRPPALAQQRGVFGLYIANDSMIPRYKPGELILASSGKRPRVGDCVVVEMKPTADEMAGVGYVKEFVRQTATQTVVHQFNPPKDLIFDNREIKHVYKVLDYEDLIGL